ncbi:MAG: hypothetical protein ACKOPI_04130 [bacterium]
MDPGSDHEQVLRTCPIVIAILEVAVVIVAWAVLVTWTVIAAAGRIIVGADRGE